MSKPTCCCGCEQPIPPKHLFRYKEPYLLRGHAPKAALICSCGCGGPIPWRNHYRTKPARVLPGHRSPSHVAAYERLRTRPRADGTETCACGCGRALPGGEGAVLRQFISGHNSVGMKRGVGRLLNAHGYVLVYAPRHPFAKPRMKGYVLEHRLVVESELGRPLARHEHVHHRNGIKTDNRRENLEVIDMRSHGAKHGRPKGWRMTPEQRVAHSDRMRRWWAARKAGQARTLVVAMGDREVRMATVIGQPTFAHEHDGSVTFSVPLDRIGQSPARWRRTKGN